MKVERVDGLWTVFVIDEGETIQRGLEKQEWAESFAEGQFGSTPATWSSGTGHCFVMSAYAPSVPPK